LRQLAESTGGTVLFITDTAKGAELRDTLREHFDRLSQELRKLYVLAYRPADQDLDGKWHRLRVEVTRPNLSVRFRESYFAGRSVH
jgi:VWFA-related protein